MDMKITNNTIKTIKQFRFNYGRITNTKPYESKIVVYKNYNLKIEQQQITSTAIGL